MSPVLSFIIPVYNVEVYLKMHHQDSGARRSRLRGDSRG